MLIDPWSASKVRSSARNAAAFALVCALISPTVAGAQQQLPPYLSDRGTGIATSMFGQYVRSGELLVYPFYEYTSFHEMEYKPAELGFGVDQDFRGKFREHEANFFLAYAFNDRVALELESALFTSAKLWKDPSDPSPMPATIEESGFGDTQAEIRYRFAFEKANRPELFSYLEVDFPFQRNRLIIGTQGWEFKYGVGAIKGFPFGTLTLRLAGESTQEDKRPALGEYALEYLKRFSPKFRFYTGIEGDQDEVEYIIEGQYWLTRYIHLKLNTAFGLTSKAPDFAPEIGIMFSFQQRMMYPR